MSITIRRATPDDAGIMVAFNAALAWETEEKRLKPEVVAAGVAAVFADPTRGFYTVAVDEVGEVIGQTMVTFEWSDWRNGWFWWIQSVYVRDDARRKGVFRALYKDIERQAATDATVIGLRLYLERTNDRAQSVYANLGMTDSGYSLMEEYPLPGRGNDIE